ncbi:glycoside hydrolase family 113 [Noviherbaspirillum sp. Root189]|uniref:glycoside hydrolase family 113 n=1 Tax=Noviherbaspirillum sp. Root189 TaxID=1736487 RepID=UPI00070D503C|nr:DUF4214 domain-containing protein [Noviherbaspirillum sp. Root189]KRB67978.1 hypothetical protein ASE07_10020 [Noviherbaspirillum sp. Root189]
MGQFEIRAFSMFDLFNASGETKLSPSELADVRAYMDDYKALGHNAVSLGWGVPIDPATGARVASFSMDGVHEASFDEIRQLANYAKSIGLQVILKPFAQTSISTGTNGTLPDNINSVSTKDFANFSVSTFLKDWAVYIGQVSSLAKELGAVEIVIGTENHGIDTVDHRGLWQEVINAARSQFSGPLSYDALFPLQRHTGVDKVGFWDLLDVIGVSAYYPLTNKENPTYADVLAGWHNNYIFPDYSGTPVDVIATLHAMSLQYGKPVQFEEFGAQSFHGVVKDPSGLTINSKVADWEQQAWAYQSVLEAFAADNASGWFRGISAWGQALVPGQDDPRFSQYLAEVASTNFDVRGKDAAKVLSAWYSATNYLTFGDKTFTGSSLDDRIALYGKAEGAATKAQQVNTFPMKITLGISGTILAGETPSVHLYVNGVDYGTRKLENIASGYVDATGPWTTQQQFTISLPAITDLSELKVVHESSSAAGQANAKVYLASASVNGVALTQIDQSTKTITIGGNAWNSGIAGRTTGTVYSALQVDGGAGSDTVYVLGNASKYAISYQDNTTIKLAETSGLAQNAVLKNVETVNFADGSVYSVTTKKFSTFSVDGGRAAAHLTKNGDGSVAVTDQNGNAYTISSVEKLRFSDMTVDLGAPSKAASLSTAELNSLIELYIAYFNRVPDAEGLGYWIGELKGGKSLEEIGQSFYNAALQFSNLTGYTSSMNNADFVKLVYANVLGRTGSSAPPQPDIDFWAHNLANGTDTRGSLIKTMLSAAHSFKGDAQWGWVADLLDNKLEVGKTFAVGYGLTYLNGADSVAHGMAIAAAVKADDTSAAIKLIGITDTAMGV